MFRRIWSMSLINTGKIKDETFQGMSYEDIQPIFEKDVLDLHKLVKARYMTSSPEGYDLMLWGDLKILFEPDEEDEDRRNHKD
ncbi:hypothetical protein Tco_0543410 [Tanacetum coccineum]